MGIPSETWFSTVAQEWYGSTLTPDEFQQLWQEFLSSDSVKYLPANATAADYQSLFLQYIAPQISKDVPWFGQLAQETYGGSLTPDEVEQIVQSFLALPQVLALPQPPSETSLQNLYLQYLAQIILSQDPWYQNATQQFCGTLTSEQFEQLLMNFLGSSAVQALPSTATPEDYQALYMQFLSSQLKQANQIAAATVVSPDTIAQSKVLWSVFELLAQMITTSSVAQIRDTEVMEYLTEKKNQYANMLAAVPLYVGTGNVDQNLNATLASQGLEAYTTTTTNLVNSPTNPIDHFNSDLNTCEWNWSDGLIVNGGNLKATLAEVFQGCVNSMVTTGNTTAEYVSPGYDVVAGGTTYQLCIQVTEQLNPDGTPTTNPPTYTAAWARVYGGQTPQSWNPLAGTFTTSLTPQVVGVNSNPIETSSADSANTSITFSTDPSQFKLGYGGISLQDLSNSIYNSYSTSTDQTSSYTLYSGDWLTGPSNYASLPLGSAINTTGSNYQRNRIVVNVSNSADGQPVVTVSLVQDTVPIVWTQDNSSVANPLGELWYNRTSPPANPDGTVDWTTATIDGDVTTQTLVSQTINVSVPASPIGSPPDAAAQTAITNAINSTFTSVWQEGTNDLYIGLKIPLELTTYELSQGTAYDTYAMNARDPKIAYQAGILASSSVGTLTDYNQNTVFTLDEATRAQENQLLQSYLSTINAKMQVLDNTSTQQQQVVSTSTSGVDSTNNMINSIIQQFSQILSTIFK